MISVGLKDAKNGSRVKVSEQRQLITAPISYSSAIATTFAVDDQAYNIVAARSGYRIVITSVFLYADKNVGANDASVEIYEAIASDSATVSKSIVALEIPKNGSIALNGLNWVTSKGVFLNGKTNDNNIYSVVGAYYIPGDIDTDLIV